MEWGGLHRYRAGFPHSGEGGATIIQFVGVNIHLTTSERVNFIYDASSCHGGTIADVSVIVWWVKEASVVAPAPPTPGPLDPRAFDPNLPFWEHVIAYETKHFTLKCYRD